MAIRLQRIGTGAGTGLWSVLALFLLAIIVPTACLFWFLTEAVRNEQMAVRQKLADVYDSQLRNLLPAIEQFWTEKASRCAGTNGTVDVQERFARLVQAGMADSYLLFDEAGQLVYPQMTEPGRSPDPTRSIAWANAESREYEEANPEAAEAAYAEIALTADNVNVAARALQARVRCLVKCGRESEAVKIIEEILTDSRYESATDNAGRLILPDVQLFALQRLKANSGSDRATMFNRLADRVRNYGKPSMPSSQRLFLMEELAALDHSLVFRTLAAERLAAKYLSAQVAAPPSGKLSPWAQTTLWQLPSTDRRVALLLTRERITDEMQSFIDRQSPVAGATIRCQSKGATEHADAFLKASAGSYLSDWELALYLEGKDPFKAASERQVAIYRWAALLVIVMIAVLALLTARLLLRQMRLTRLKNDFVATVSHELKTPLASMRVLVDTLIDGNYRDEQQVKEYLGLIAKENERLSRLIDNFLSFSRMERNKRSFEFRETHPAAIVQAAFEAVRPRFESAGFALLVEIQPDLPAIVVDSDAMATVLLNLLDNAYKYSSREKKVILRAHRDGDSICFEVKDRGIGLSHRDTRKIFQRFYQVDHTLSRREGGCGLGLSIVKFIVDAHGGSVGVESELGQGSCFTVRIPRVRRE